MTARHVSVALSLPVTVMGMVTGKLTMTGWFVAGSVWFVSEKYGENMGPEYDDTLMLIPRGNVGTFHV